LPAQNYRRAQVPQALKAYAGVYDTGALGLMDISFTDDSLILTPIMVKNERRQEYIYNTDGVFVSENGDYLGYYPPSEVTRGATEISFAEYGKAAYLMVQTHERQQGLGLTAYALPLAMRLGENAATDAAQAAWSASDGREYLLVSEKYTSSQYTSSPVAKTLTDARAPGYVAKGIYRGGGFPVKAAKIVDEDAAIGFQDTPTMMGRDTNNLRAAQIGGVSYLHINEYRFVDAAATRQFSEIGDTVTVGAETAWFDVDEAMAGKTVAIDAPANGAWFVYDDKMRCIATSLAIHPQHMVILPNNGRLAFAGEPGAAFEIR
jgi:hypothetical protein